MASGRGLGILGWLRRRECEEQLQGMERSGWTGRAWDCLCLGKHPSVTCPAGSSALCASCASPEPPSAPASSFLGMAAKGPGLPRIPGDTSLLPAGLGLRRGAAGTPQASARGAAPQEWGHQIPSHGPAEPWRWDGSKGVSAEGRGGQASSSGGNSSFLEPSKLGRSLCLVVQPQ